MCLYVRKLLSAQSEGWATLSLTAFPMPAMDWVSKCPGRENYPSGRCLYKRKNWDKQLKWMGLQNLPEFTLIGSRSQSCHRWCVVHELHINVLRQPGLSKSWAIYACEAEHVFWRLSGRPWHQVCSRQTADLSSEVMPGASKTCRASVSPHIWLLAGSSSPGHGLMGRRAIEDLKELVQQGHSNRSV